MATSVSGIQFLTVHGLAVKKAAGPEAVASVIDAEESEVEAAIEAATTAGHVAGANGTYMVTPAGRAWLDEHYPEEFRKLRDDGRAAAAFEKFERVNRDLLALFTDWQSVSVGGETLPNDHTDAAYDRKIIDRLGDLHERAEKVLANLGNAEPRLAQYEERLAAAYDKILGGEIDFVSGVRVDSYHTIWFELHEDLLRMLGRTREE